VFGKSPSRVRIVVDVCGRCGYSPGPEVECELRRDLATIGEPRSAWQGELLRTTRLVLAATPR